MACEHLSHIGAGCCGPSCGCLHRRESNACPDGCTRYRSHSAGCRGCRAAHGNTHPEPGHWRHRRGPGGGHARRHPHADTCANRYSDADTTSNRYSDANTPSNRYSDADTCANRYSHANAPSNGCSHANTPSNGYSHANTPANRYPDT